MLDYLSSFSLAYISSYNGFLNVLSWHITGHLLSIPGVPVTSYSMNSHSSLSYAVLYLFGLLIKKCESQKTALRIFVVVISKEGLAGTRMKLPSN